MDTTLVFFSISELKIVTARHLLAEAGIESYTIDKKDSAMSGILGGGIELYVRKSDSEKARDLLAQEDLLD